MGVSKELLMRRRNLGSPHIATATGAVASFAGNMVAPFKQLKCEFTPVQSGSGDPSPINERPISGWTGCEVSRTGMNVWDEEWEVGTIDPTTGEDSPNIARIRTKGYIPVVPGTSYYFAYPNTAGSGRGIWYNKNKEVVSSSTTFNYGVITAPANAYFLRFSPSTNYGSTYNNDISLNYPSTATSYAPYTGNTYAVEFPATKNLITSTIYGGDLYYNANGTDLKKTTTHATFTESNNAITVTTDGSWYGCLFTTGELAAGTYNVHLETEDEDLRPTIYVTDSGLISKERYVPTSENKVITVSQGDRIAVALVNLTAESITVTNLQVESGNSYTGFEPYGTVYGGYVDPVRGVVVAEWAKKICVGSGDENWGVSLSSGLYRAVMEKDRFADTGLPQDRSPLMANYCRNNGASQEWNAWIGSTGNFLCFLPSEYDTVAKWRAYLAEHNLEICYKLATPIEYPLTPQLIKSLKGTNNVFSSLNGNCSVAYWKH